MFRFAVRKATHASRGEILLTTTVATVAVALCAALIALGHWRVARQKLMLDLFDKRFQVYMELRSIVSEAVQFNQIKEKGRINEVIARAQFLFDDDINDHLKKIHSLVCELDPKRRHTVGKLSEAFDEVRPLFDSYLAMKQKYLNLPWE